MRKEGMRMALQQTSYRGCLLGMAVGDAMGYTVDNRSLSEIREDYGPNGLLGYDLATRMSPPIPSWRLLPVTVCSSV